MENAISERNGEKNARGSNDLKSEISNNNVSAKLVAKVKKARSFMELSVHNIHNSYALKNIHRNDRRVLVIYTGGTIGMVKSKNGGMFYLKIYLEVTYKKRRPKIRFHL